MNKLNTILFYLFLVVAVIFFLYGLITENEYCYIFAAIFLVIDWTVNFLIKVYKYLFK